jgi:hypothetical protein
MKNLFEATVANQVKSRLGKLEPQTVRNGIKRQQFPRF